MNPIYRRICMNLLLIYFIELNQFTNFLFTYKKMRDEHNANKLDMAGLKLLCAKLS